MIKTAKKTSLSALALSMLSISTSSFAEEINLINAFEYKGTDKEIESVWVLSKEYSQINCEIIHGEDCNETSIKVTTELQVNSFYKLLRANNKDIYEQVYQICTTEAMDQCSYPVIEAGYKTLGGTFNKPADPDEILISKQIKSFNSQIKHLLTAKNSFLLEDERPDGILVDVLINKYTPNKYKSEFKSSEWKYDNLEDKFYSVRMFSEIPGKEIHPELCNTAKEKNSLFKCTIPGSNEQSTDDLLGSFFIIYQK